MARTPGFHYGLALLVILMITVACSGGKNPVMPGGELVVTGAQNVEEPSNRMLWGYWTCTIDPISGTVEAQPIRGALMHVNAVLWMQPPGGSLANLGIGITYDDYLANGRFDLDVSLTHPFDGFDQFTGFDVMGVFMTDGHYDLLSQSGITVSDGILQYTEDPNAVYDATALTDAVMLNPDGYTRWWNQDEFDEPDMKIFSYIPGQLGVNAEGLDAVLNPFKYFAQGIGNTDVVSEYIELNMGARGMFPAGATITRDYRLMFAKPGEYPVLEFDYAVVANWEASDPNPPINIPEDFPLAANAYEPVAVSVTDNSDIYYDDVNDVNGGQVDWFVELYDWQGLNPATNIDSIIDRMVVEFIDSDQVPGGNIFDSDAYTWTVTAGKTNSSVYHVEIPAADINPAAYGNTPAVLIFETNDDYDNGFPTEFPSGPLSSYFMTELNIYGAQGTPTCESPVPEYTDRHYFEVENFTAVIDAPGGTLYNIDWSVEPSGNSQVWVNTDLEEVPVNWYNATSSGANLGLYDVCVSVYSAEGWSMCCTEVPVLVDDIPPFGPQTGMENHTLPNQPDQGAQPCDIAVYYSGTSSIGEVMYQDLGGVPNPEIRLFKFNDDYSNIIGITPLDTGYDWVTPDPSTLDPAHFADFHKFDATNSIGNVIHLTSANNAWPSIVDPTGININDPFHSYIMPASNPTGNVYYLSLFGDGGSGGLADPDTEPWKHIVDWTAGVTAGPSSEFYGLYTLSEEWLPAHSSYLHPGYIGLSYSTAPYTSPESDLEGWLLGAMSTQYTSPPGPIDDTDPNKMAVAVDNATGLEIDWLSGPGEILSDLVVFYVISSEPTPTDRKVHIIWMPEDTSIGAFAYDEFIGNGSPWGTGIDFAGGVPVDVEVLYTSNTDTTIDHTFNYLAVLVDIGAGFRVDIFRYDPYWPRLDLVTQYNPLLITNPTSMDIDSRANEIHILHESPMAYHVTVLQFNP